MAAGAKRKALERARREYAPTVQAFGTLDWDGEEPGDMARSYLAGLAMEWELFSGFGRGHAVRAAAADYEAARAELEQLRNRLRFDLRAAWLGARDAFERLEVTDRSVESAEEALRMTRERYEQGAADITELLAAQLGATAIRTRRTVARYDYLMALSNVERARGRLADRYEAGTAEREGR